MKLGPGMLKTCHLRTLFDLLSTPSGSRAQVIAVAVPLEKIIIKITFQINK
jgi:hypothetical protein